MDLKKDFTVAESVIETALHVILLHFGPLFYVIFFNSFSLTQLILEISSESVSNLFLSRQSEKG